MMDIHYTIKRSRRRKKTLCLQVTSLTEITVYAPAWTSESEIRRFIDEKKNWVAKALRTEAERVRHRLPKQFVSGETLYFLGRPYPLDVFFDPLQNLGLSFRENVFYLNCPSDVDMKKFFTIAWYKKRAGRHLSARVEHWSRIMDLSARGIRITQAKSRWGSCSEKNVLALSFRLMMAPPEVIDYIVVHELAHIAEKNHSSKFWNKVIEIIPDYKNHRRWLREHQHLFEI